MNTNIKIFTDIYKNKVWGKSGNKNNKYYKGSSGPGSTILYNKVSYIPFIKNFILKNNVKSVVDLGCGDWQSSHLIYLSFSKLKYCGYDAYKDVCDYNRNKYPQYKFVHLDIIENRDKLEDGDLCIIKDVLQHLSNEDIDLLLNYIISKKKYKYILITNCCNQLHDNQNIKTGGWRQLTAKMNPLKKFKPVIVKKYKTKEISLIVCK